MFCRKRNGTKSWLDHIKISNDLVVDAHRVSVPYLVTPSDHVPVKISLRASPLNSTANQTVTKVVKKQKINWKQLTTEQKCYYCSTFMSKLDKLALDNLCTMQNC